MQLELLNSQILSLLPSDSMAALRWQQFVEEATKLLENGKSYAKVNREN